MSGLTPRRTVTANEIRKGMHIYVSDILVRVTRKERWNKDRIKITFEDMGNGLPVEGSPNTGPVAITAMFYMLADSVTVVS